SDLEAVISEILDNISLGKKSECSSASELRPVSIFLDAAKFTNDVEGSSERSMSFEDFRTWCRLVPSARKFLVSLLKPSST
nr:calcium-binding EF-hand [Tanacetum cinerariifolium]